MNFNLDNEYSDTRHSECFPLTTTDKWFSLLLIAAVADDSMSNQYKG